MLTDTVHSYGDCCWDSECGSRGRSLVAPLWLLRVWATSIRGHCKMTPCIIFAFHFFFFIKVKNFGFVSVSESRYWCLSLQKANFWKAGDSLPGFLLLPEQSPVSTGEFYSGGMESIEPCLSFVTSTRLQSHLQVLVIIIIFLTCQVPVVKGTKLKLVSAYWIN